MYKPNTHSEHSYCIIIFVCVCMVASYLTYSVAFDAPFYFDTIFHLHHKQNLHMTTINSTQLMAATLLDHGAWIYRPLSSLSLALTYYFFQLTPKAYRIGNLIIHFGAAFSLAFMLLSVLRTPKVRRTTPLLSEAALCVTWLAVGLWAMHPFQTNVVTYIIQRMASLSGLFYFLAFGCFLRARCAGNGWSWKWGSLFLVSAFLAVASKENSATLVLVVALAEVLLLDPPDSLMVRRWRLWVGTTAVLAILVLLAWKGQDFWIKNLSWYEQRDFSLTERLLTQARLQGRYLLMLLIPDPRLLSIDAQVQLSRSFFSPPATAYMVLALVAALSLAALTFRSKPILSFGILWFLFAQSIESTIIPLELYFEHRMYIPSAFIYLGLSAFIFRVVQHLRFRRVFVPLLVFLMLGVESWATYQRNQTWSNPILLWADEIDKNPENPRPYLQLGRWLVVAREHEQAQELFQRCIDLGGDVDLVHYNQAILYYSIGEEINVILHLEQVTDANGYVAGKAYGWLSLIYLNQGDVPNASKYISKALANRTYDARLWNVLGMVKMRKGDREGAQEAFAKAREIDPAFQTSESMVLVPNDSAGGAPSTVRLQKSAQEWFR